jgi:hypothetical protein
MPQSVAIGLLALGGVLLLIAIIGGNFKIFGAEISERISSAPMRFLAGVLGIVFIFLALSPGRLASGGDPPATDNTATTERPKPISSSGAGIVFDPPSNIRASPSNSATILCSVQAKTTINLLGFDGTWYATDFCGKVGYIHKTQVKF